MNNISKQTLKGTNSETGEVETIYPKSSADQIIYDNDSGRDVTVKDVLDDYRNFKSVYHDVADYSEDINELKNTNNQQNLYIESIQESLANLSSSVEAINNINIQESLTNLSSAVESINNLNIQESLANLSSAIDELENRMSDLSDRIFVLEEEE